MKEKRKTAGRWRNIEELRRIKKKLRRWDVLHFWHPYTQMKFYREIKPPIIVEAEGNYLVDIDGKKYFDAVSSIWCIIHGHSKKEITEGIIDEIKRVQHTTTLGLANPTSILLAKELADISGLPKVFFSEDGAEAVEIAVKISFSFARRKSKRNLNPRKIRFASVKGAYHGDTIGAMSVAGKTPFTEEYSPLMFPTLEFPPIYCMRCKWNRSREKGQRKCSLECLEVALEKLRRNRKRICAVFLEGGVQGAAGIIPYPHGYIKAMREETKKHGILLVVDEVATGFGKTGKMFGYEWELGRNNLPDIVCLGKGLSGGYLPAAATLCSEEVFQVFHGEQWEYKHLLHGHTFTGNPIIMRSALENIRLIKEKNVIEEARRKIPYIERRVYELLEDDFVGDVRGRGFMWGIELVKEGRESFPPQVLAGWRVTLEMWKRGVFIRPLGDTLVLNLPLSVREKEIDLVVETLKESLKVLRKFK